MDHPFLDLSGVSDEEIIERIVKCQSYRAFESRMGSQTMTSSIDQMLMALTMEMENRRHRAFLEGKKKGAGTSDIIEIGKIEGNPDESW